MSSSEAGSTVIRCNGYRFQRPLINVISAVISLYLNVFVLIVQAFLKIPALKEIAPTQNDPPFKFTQIVVLSAFVVLGILAALKFRSGVPAGAIASTERDLHKDEEPTSNS